MACPYRRQRGDIRGLTPPARLILDGAEHILIGKQDGQDISSTAAPSTSRRGTTPRPGAVDAAMRPLTRRGAPSAMLTVT